MGFLSHGGALGASELRRAAETPGDPVLRGSGCLVCRSLRVGQPARETIKNPGERLAVGGCKDDQLFCY